MKRNYVVRIQVYNERISRLALEARQARHRADAAMRKLRELVQACKTQDLEAVSNLAVQVDTDSLAPPYSDIPPWEQQVSFDRSQFSRLKRFGMISFTFVLDVYQYSF